MIFRVKSQLTPLALPLLLGVLGLTLTACGPRYNHIASNSPACHWNLAPQNCVAAGNQAAYYGAQPNAYNQYAQGYNQGQYNLGQFNQNQFNWINQGQYQQGQYYQQHYGPNQILSTNSQFGVNPSISPSISYVQSPHSIISYEPVPAPIEPPAPIHITPIDISEPVIASTSAWTQTETADPYPWQPEKVCPEGTIRGYNGDSCLQIAIPRK